MSAVSNTLRRILRRRDEAGTTVMELVVSIALLGIVLPVAFTAVSSMQKTEAHTTDRFTAQSDAQIMASRLSKDIRAAAAPSATGSAFTVATTQDIVFHASLADPNGPTRLHAYIAQVPGTSVAALFEDQTAPDASSVAPNYTYSGTATTRINGRYLDAAAPIFSFYRANGTLIPAPVTNSADLRAIASVGISLTTRVTPTSPSTTITTRVHVRNVEYAGTNT